MRPNVDVRALYMGAPKSASLVLAKVIVKDEDGAVERGIQEFRIKQFAQEWAKLHLSSRLSFLSKKAGSCHWRILGCSSAPTTTAAPWMPIQHLSW